MANTTESDYKLVKGQHQQMAFEIFHEMRQVEELCDVTVDVDGEQIRAHRIVLAACSPYFRAMLTAGFAESFMSLISLQDCNSRAVKSMIDYFYTTEIQLNASNAEDILAIASLFQVPTVVEQCGEYLQDQITISNCLGIQSLAIQYSLTSLKSKVDIFIRWNFMDLCLEEEFVLIPAPQLLSIIKSDTLHVSAEDKVFEAVARWYKHDKERLRYKDIMAFIRFPCMSKTFLEEVVLENELIQQEKSWKDQVEAALIYHSKPKRDIDPQLRAMAMPRRAPNVLYLIGETSTRIEMFDLDTGSCVPVEGMAQTTGAALVVAGELYTVMGGGLRIEKYNAKVNAWSQVSNGVKESETAVCEGMGHIYVIGGNRRAKCFDVSTRTWMSLPKTKIRRSFHAVATLLGKVYVLGGATLPGNRAIADVECYNPATNCWVTVAPMRTERFRHQAAVLGGRLYILGGTDLNMSPLKTVEIYEPISNSWTFVSSLNVARRDFCVGLLQEMMFVFGGSGSTNAIERYDKDTKKWTVIGTISRRWSDVKCVNYPMIQIKRSTPPSESFVSAYF